MRRLEISPLGIRMLMHFYAYPTPWPEPSQAALDLRLRFERADLISPEHVMGDPWFRRTTERGRAYVDMICATPFPEAVTRTRWFDPRFPPENDA